MSSVLCTAFGQRIAGGTVLLPKLTVVFCPVSYDEDANNRLAPVLLTRAAADSQRGGQTLGRRNRQGRHGIGKLPWPEARRRITGGLIMTDAEILSAAWRRMMMSDDAREGAKTLRQSGHPAILALAEEYESGSGSDHQFEIRKKMEGVMRGTFAMTRW
jgi:hypothetical protein